MKNTVNPNSNVAMWSLAVFSAGMLCAAVAGAQDAAPGEPVRSGCEVDYPPFCIVDADGRANGFSVELMQAALAKMGHEVTFRTGTWADVKGWLERGEIDCLPLVGRTPEREAAFDFTVPYLTMHGAVVVRADTTDVQTLKDLAGRRVGVMAGDNAEEFLRREDRGIEIVALPTFTEVFHALDDGRCDAVVIQRLVALRLLKETGLDRGLRIVDQPIHDFSQQFCFAVKEGDRGMLAVLNEGLALAVADGTHRRLHAKWFAMLELPADRPIVVGGDHNYPPFEFLDEKGRPAGFNVDLVRAVANAADLDIRIRLGNWSDIKNALERGEIDVVQGMSYTQERGRKFDFSQAHSVNHSVAVVRRDGVPPPSSLADLSGKRIVVQASDIMHEVCIQSGLTNHLTVVDSQEDALRELAAGKHDCALVARMTAFYLIKREGWENLKIGRTSLASAEYGFTVRRGSQALLAQLGEGLTAISDSGEYHRLHEKWLGVYEEHFMWRDVLRIVAMVAVPLLLLVLLALLWSWTLRKQVAQRTAELYESKENLRTTLKSIGDAVISTDMDGLVAAMNPVAESLAGWSEQEAIGESLVSVFKIINEETRNTVESPVTNVLKTGNIVGLANHTLLVSKDGREIPIADSGAPIRNDAGEITGVVLVFRDQTKERAARKALEASEAKFRSYVENAPYGIFIADRDGHYVDVNPAASTITGYSRDELLDMCIPDLVSGDSRELGARHFQTLLASGRSDGEFGFVRKTGDQRQWHVAAQRLSQDRFLGFVEDVTERRRAEEELRHSHRLMKYIIEHTQSAVAVHDKDLKYIYVSQRYLDEYNVKDKDIIGKHHYDVFPDLPQKWRDVHQKVLKGAVLSAEDDPYERDDGSVEWTRWECRPWYENDDTIGGIIVYTEVITERKQIERQLIEQKNMLAAIYRNTPLVMMVVNNERRIQQVNGFATQFANHNVEEMLGLRGGEALRCMHVLDDPKGCGFGEFCQLCVIRNTVLDTLETGAQHLQMEAPYHFKGENGEIRELQLMLWTTPIEIKGERMVLVILQDITERKQAEAEQRNLEAQLMQAQKMESIGRLAGGVAHDFNNLLMGIMGYADLCRDGLPEAHPVREWLDEITKEAQRSANLTRQLLAFARKQTVAPVVVDLNDLVGNMLKMLRRLIGEDIDLVWQPGAGLWSTKIDPSQLDQILANLCVNARDAINGVGKITIETNNVSIDESYCADHVEASPGAHVMLAVSDDGCGMDHETLRNIFEPFFTTKPTGEGTGLGLATVYGIVKQNRGFVNVYSEPGKGTTFRIYLPRETTARKESAAETTGSALRGGSETILLVEDEAGIRFTIRLFLERFGYTVIAASCPEEALRLVAEHPDGIDLLITDVVMPGMSGRELAEKLAPDHPSMKILYMSGYTANVIAHRGILDEGVQFLSKPISRDELAQKVRDVLG